jgi:hypothetical protein
VHWFVVRPLSSLWCFSFSAGALLFPIQPIHIMEYLGVNQASRLTGKSPTTVTRRAANLPFLGGENGTAKKYEAPALLEALYSVGTGGGDSSAVSTEQAQKELAIARKQQIDLQNEVLRKERVPLETLEQINEEAFANVAAMLKAQTGKTLTEELINDIYSQFRDIAAKVKEKA